MKERAAAIAGAISATYFALLFPITVWMILDLDSGIIAFMAWGFMVFLVAAYCVLATLFNIWKEALRK